MKYVGAHVSAAGGVENSPKNAHAIGAKAYALFTKNQRQWFAKDLTDESIEKFKALNEEFGFKPENILAHDSYLINMGNPDEEKREKATLAFIDELKRVEQLGLDRLNFHPGSHLKAITEEQCLDYIADNMSRAIDASNNAKLVMELTAGQGSNVGYKFEHMAHILDKVNDPSRVGVCIDTCHIFSAGYDISTNDGYEDVMKHFDELIGFDKLMGVHLNDCKVELGKKVDRHHSLGEGFIGWGAFENIMNDVRFENVPMVLETIDQEIWPEEIKSLYKLVR